MEKEKLSDELRTLAGQTSHSPQTWGSYIDNIVMPFMPAEEDKIPDYLRQHAEFLKTQNGQYGKDIADLTNTQVASKVEEFKKNYKPIENPQNSLLNPQNPQAVDPNESLKPILDRLEKIESEKMNAEKQASLSLLLTDVESDLKANGADHDGVLDIAVGLTKISDGETKESIREKIKTEYDKQYSKLFGNGYVPSGVNRITPTVDSVKAKRIKAEMDAIRKNMKV